jgi:hypothetical protein
MTPCFVVNGLVMGAIGAYWDWQHHGRTTIFSGARDTPGVASGVRDATAQPSAAPTIFDFSALNLRRGQHVSVTASDGTRTTGVITAIDSRTFRVGAVDLSGLSPEIVERIGDPIWDGVAFGAGVAVMQALASGSGLRSGTKLAAVYGSIGGLIDAALKGRTLLYGSSDALGRSSSVRLIPEIDAHRKALSVAIGFK